MKRETPGENERVRTLREQVAFGLLRSPSHNGAFASGKRLVRSASGVRKGFSPSSQCPFRVHHNEVAVTTVTATSLLPWPPGLAQGKEIATFSRSLPAEIQED